MTTGDPPVPAPAEHSRARRLRELAFLYLRLGATAFGGPAAHIALMEDEVVVKRRWIERQRFADLLGAANLIPGPNSTEMAIHIGYDRAGWPGLLVAGASFILPATAITLVAAWAYVRYGARPGGEALLYGVKPVVIAVVAQAIARLGRTVVATRRAAIAAVIALAATLAGAPEVAVLLGTGVALVAAHRVAAGAGAGAQAIAPAPWLTALGAAGSAPFTLGGLFVVFLKIGAVLFGSGYVLLAFLRTELVEARHWLTEAQLLDAVAAGQITPGPVFSTATFVGYFLARGRGAAVATLGIFVPAFVFVAVTAPFVARMRRWPAASAFLDGVNAASLALMAAVTWYLARAALVDGVTAAIAVTSAVLLLRFRVNSTWLILGGAALGIARRFLAG